MCSSFKKQCLLRCMMPPLELLVTEATEVPIKVQAIALDFFLLLPGPDGKTMLMRIPHTLAMT